MAERTNTVKVLTFTPILGLNAVYRIGCPISDWMSGNVRGPYLL